MRSDTTHKHGGIKGNSSSDPTGKPTGGQKLRLKFPKLWRTGNTGQVVQIATSTPDGHPALEDIQPITVPLTFEQHLEERHLSEAGQLLLARENCLFVGVRHKDDDDVVRRWKEDLNTLVADRKALEDAVLQTLRGSLSQDQADTAALKSAVVFMRQEDDQDQLWEQRGGAPPPWRLSNWREVHEKTLRGLVEERMDVLMTPPTDLAGKSSIQVDVHGMGRQLRQDLLLVVQHVKKCYPESVNICQLYANLYHQTFSTRLRKLADFGLDDPDCIFLLRWVNEYYPQLLQELQLAGDIHTDVLRELLPENLLSPLEEQYLSRQQRELTTYIGRILDEARKAWTKGEDPLREDGCFVSPMAYDIIQLVNGIVTAAEKVVGDLQKAQVLTCPLQNLLHRFRAFQVDVIKLNKTNSVAFVKANLDCVAQFRDFLVRKSSLFPEEVQESCQSVLTDMKECAHEYLLRSVHKNLKPHYRRLGTNVWLTKSPFDNLCVCLEEEMMLLQGTSESCHQELIGQLHQEVALEYVRRLLKGELKLKDKEQQHRACILMKENTESLHYLFIKYGSKEAWLKEVLGMIAEVLESQNVPAIQMQVASLGTTFPDLSEKHVMSLLKLKNNLTKEDRYNVTAVLSDIPKDSGESRPFFSRVTVK
ncbi:tumor necrosis factor alpha-induced protein 2-like [Dunckerocampus dactyliophorus]|uniref:tumor necrosis factor alpha-induced protein 2-like n=1 Tax=Dunckerocampus dactyliophorus TaxID=161453 RepID=UPI0024065879|nr:tumor necrosis factor alpha-induced protein 2-like [Dunckerocampus dactyliophorus]